MDPESGEQRDALAEGRRIYLGNLLYSALPADIENMLRGAGFSGVDKLHISIDPVSGRNPGYCFVEFTTREEADRALSSLGGTPLFGRPVKVGPCHPKTTTDNTSGPRGGAQGPTFERWGDWRGAGAAGGAAGPNHARDGEQQQGPYAALRRIDYESPAAESTRLCIRGLGRMIDQPHHQAEMRELLAGFDVVAIGKRITPDASTRSLPGNHHYCFVDFVSHEEAKRAMGALQRRPVPGGRLHVSLARKRAGPMADASVNSWHPANAASPAEAGGEETVVRTETGSETGRFAGGAAGGHHHHHHNGNLNMMTRTRQVDGVQGQGQEQGDRYRAIMASSSWRRQ